TEAVDLAVAVAGEVGNDGLTGGHFSQPVDGHHREGLANRPKIRQRLNYADIRVINVRQLLGEVLEDDGHPVQLGNQLGDLLQHRQVVVFADGAHPQVDLAAAELDAQGLQVVNGVVVALLDVLEVGGFQQGGQHLHFHRGVGGQLLRQRAGLELADGEDIEQQHR